MNNNGIMVSFMFIGGWPAWSWRCPETALGICCGCHPVRIARIYKTMIYTWSQIILVKKLFKSFYYTVNVQCFPWFYSLVRTCCFKWENL